MLLDIAGTAVLALGLTLATIGLIGMLRMREPLHQLHATGLVTGPATIVVLLAAVATRNTEIITSAGLVILFVLVTSPLSGHALAQAAFRRRAARDGTASRPPAGDGG